VIFIRQFGALRFEHTLTMSFVNLWVGFSQGSLIVGLASEYDDRVSAALLYGSGNLPGYLEFTLAGIRDMQCMNTVKLAKQRRRYFSGDNDRLFGGDYDGTRTQLAGECNLPSF